MRVLPDVMPVVPSGPIACGTIKLPSMQRSALPNHYPKKAFQFNGGPVKAKAVVRMLLAAASIYSSALLESCDGSGKWGWKKSTDPDDVMNFLNGKSPYVAPVAEARVSAVWKGSYAEFYVFYVPGKRGQPAGGWGWKKSTDPADAMNFL